jgi:hypothetical protein
MVIWIGGQLRLRDDDRIGLYYSLIETHCRMDQEQRCHYVALSLSVHTDRVSE